MEASQSVSLKCLHCQSEFTGWKKSFGKRGRCGYQAGMMSHFSAVPITCRVLETSCLVWIPLMRVFQKRTVLLAAASLSDQGARGFRRHFNSARSIPLVIDASILLMVACLWVGSCKGLGRLDVLSCLDHNEVFLSPGFLINLNPGLQPGVCSDGRFSIN
jgi:hypothetical protein